MLIFHEGLPGSGKSYEAAINRIIPALKQKRQVFAYIEGLNFEKFAEVTSIPVTEIKGEIIKTEISQAEKKNHKYVIQEGNQFYSIEYKGLLFQIESEQVPNIFQHVANDALVIIDELQDFFPASMRKLSDGITKFVTQHRHRGLDIVAMGQDHRDCHNLWKRRIDQLIHFIKQDAIGRSHKYTWQTYKQRNGKFQKLRSGTGEYDPKYFGLYLSHVPDAKNTDTYSDDRTNIFKSTAFRVYLPVFLCVCIGAGYYLYTIFSGKKSIVKVDKAPSPLELAKAQTQSGTKKINVPENLPPAPLTRSEKITRDYAETEYIEAMASQYRPRLAALIYDDTKTVARIEFLDDSFHAKESLTLVQLKALGWNYERKPYGIMLYKKNLKFVVTSWPLDIYGRVSQRTNEQINDS